MKTGKSNEQREPHAISSFSLWGATVFSFKFDFFNFLENDKQVMGEGKKQHGQTVTDCFLKGLKYSHMWVED